MEKSETEIIFKINKLSSSIGYEALKCKEMISTDWPDSVWVFTTTGHPTGKWDTKEFRGKTSREAILKAYFSMKNLARNTIDKINSALEEE